MYQLIWLVNGKLEINVLVSLNPRNGLAATLNLISTNTLVLPKAPSFILNGISTVVRSFVVVVFYVPIQYCTVQYEKIFLRNCSDRRLLLLHFDFQKKNASNMPRKRAPEAVQHDSTRNQQGRSDKSVQDRERTNKRRRERYAQRTLEERENDNARRRKKRAGQPEEGRAQVNEQRRQQYAQESALQTPQEREQNNAQRRQQYAQESALQTPQEREQTNAQRRQQYAQESALQTPEEREQTNAQRRELRTELDAEERERINAQRREHGAQERAEQTPVEQEQNNARHRETYAERRARNLGKTRNNFIREPEASLDDIKLHSVGELCLTCRKCDARLFKGERTAPGNTFSFCCAQGQVQIPRTPRLSRTKENSITLCSSTRTKISLSTRLDSGSVFIMIIIKPFSRT